MNASLGLCVPYGAHGGKVEFGSQATRRSPRDKAEERSALIRVASEIDDTLGRGGGCRWTRRQRYSKIIGEYILGFPFSRSSFYRSLAPCKMGERGQYSRKDDLSRRVLVHMTCFANIDRALALCWADCDAEVGTGAQWYVGAPCCSLSSYVLVILLGGFDLFCGAYLATR